MNIGDVHWRAGVRFESHLAESFGEHRMWLAGDAGHMIGPVGVQSMNVGLREAAELTDIIARIIQDGVPMTALERYGAGRTSEWSMMLGNATPLPEAADWVHRYSSRILSCLPASGRELTQLASQLGLELP